MKSGPLLKKEKTLKRSGKNEPDSGDCYTYTAVKRESYLFAACSIGKWTQQTCLCMMRKLAKALKLPSFQCPLEMFTDGNDDYAYVLPLCFQLGLVDYGQLIKIRKNGKVVGKRKVVVYGEPSLDDIETTVVENFNSILRERLGRLVRKSKCFSKLKWRLVCSVELFKFFWNFINEFKRGFSPAELEGLTDHLWSWYEFYYSRQ